MTESPFATLGLDESATLTQVRAAYRLKAAECHPDLGGDPEAFIALRNAYGRAYKIAERAPCPSCEGVGTIGSGHDSFVKTIMRCAACAGTGKRNQ